MASSSSSSLLRGVLERGIGGLNAPINFSFAPVVYNHLLRGIRGGVAANHQQVLHARNFSCASVVDARNFSYASVAKNQLLRRIKGEAAVHRHQFLDARNFSYASVANNRLLIGIRGRAVHHRILTSANANANYQFDKFSRRFGTDSETVFSERLLADKLRGPNLPPIKPEGCHCDPTEEQIIISASSVIKYVDRVIKNHPDTDTDFLHGAMYKIYTDPRFQIYDEAAKMKVLSKVLDVIQTYPGVDSNQVFYLRILVKSLSVDDGKDIISEEQVSSRVVGVVQSHPMARQYKVTTTTHFHNDLHLDCAGYIYLNRALKMEFKMPVPQEIDSCKRAIDYIYANRDDRVSVQECRDRLVYVCPGIKEQQILIFIHLKNKFLSWLEARLPD